MAHVNRNFCKTFNLTLNGSTQKLADQECTEVIVCCPVAVTVYDNQNPSVGFVVPANNVFTFRGMTNSSQLSASGANTNVLSYRTQFYSGLQQTFV